jgi:MoaA/NifB/PqqE/SkfB family radical SAM enzyme
VRVEHPFRNAFDLLIRKSPIEVQLVVTRRCNLSCGYCSEFDNHSAEVPLEILERRLDAIHRLHAANIALLGGEPLLHSRIDDVIRYAARRAQVSMTTNGFLLDNSIIDRLNDAGLANLQLSIDGLDSDPQRYIQKTWRSLRPKLERLAARARFDVHLTVVLCEQTIADFPELMRQIEAYPFRVSINLVHDETGQVSVRGREFEALWNRHFTNGRAFSFIEQDYGRKLLRGEKPNWTCGAGARFLYVDESGTVELCSGQRGRVGKSILEYSEADLAAHRDRAKGCERGCAILCAYRDSQIDDDAFGLARALFKTVVRGGISGGAMQQASAVSPPAPVRRRLPLVA